MMKKIYRNKGYLNSIDWMLNEDEKYRYLRWNFDNGDQKLRPTKDEKEKFSKDVTNWPRYRKESDPFNVISHGSLNWNSLNKR